MWRLPTPFVVIQAWMKEHGFDVHISAAGKVAAQLIEAMGGTYGAFIFAYEDLLRLLNDLAHGMEEEEASDEVDDTVKKRIVRAQSVSAAKLRSVLKKSAHNNADVAENHLRSLISAGCFRVGLKLQCLTCGQRSWFDFTRLSDVLKCERCLKDISFPLDQPPKEWYYRVIGPFSVEDYAHGSYTTAFALRFLIDEFHAAATWIPSFELSAGTKKLEADFGMFWRKSLFQSYSEPELIFGECKSYNLFRTKDFKRMRALARQFTGSVLVFCTLRKVLTRKEKKEVSAIAKSGRRPLGNGQWRNPVVILTGIELLSSSGAPHCWKNSGAPFDKFGDTYWREEPLQELADITQQLHLGMDSYWDQLERERNRRIARLASNRTKQAARRSSEASKEGGVA
jgi:hypothetical protein